MKHYTAKLIGTTWWVVTHEPQFNGQTLISDHVSEAAANRAANNLNEAYELGYAVCLGEWKLSLEEA